METKDFLPLVGVSIGWLLNEASAFSKRSIEKQRTLGRAVSAIYFLCLEMIQIKMNHESIKSQIADIKEWETYRKHSFDTHANNSPEFAKQLQSTIESISDYYPVEGYQIKDILTKYTFIKNKSLADFVGHPDIYIALLSAYETGFLAHQTRLERILLSLALRHSPITWFKIRRHFMKMKKSQPAEDIVFLEQVKELANARQSKSQSK
ncbi:hypothetical protein OV208_12385 [Corallococcus sp. bb12-1]|uniref:hypothetical protein n=1 Tax=Corallococcus sp. bb12-1 TaxID=2996784 RepID=UPI00226D72E5|nr:hypothetical protein [Corallococcus sp. bb12-1]MCY1042114.1 hypothetical protein [Corallococcus sp. bb12-1]